MLCVIVGEILKIQMQVLNDSDDNAASTNTAMTNGYNETAIASGNATNSDNNNSKEFFHRHSLTSIQQYLFLRLPFELHAGYALTQVFLYLNIWLDQFNAVSPKVLVIMANISLICVMVIGSFVLWRTGRYFYGFSAALVWFLVSAEFLV